MKNAQHLVSLLLDEGFEPVYGDPEGRDLDAEVDAIEAEIEARQKRELKDAERKTGEEVEQEMRSRGWKKSNEPFRPGQVPLHGTSKKAAKDYWGNVKAPHAKRAIYQTDKGFVTRAPRPQSPVVPPAQKPNFGASDAAKHLLQIKGRQQWQPKNRTMPKPWTNWK